MTPCRVYLYVMTVLVLIFANMPASLHGMIGVCLAMRKVLVYPLHGLVCGNLMELANDVVFHIRRLI